MADAMSFVKPPHLLLEALDPLLLLGEAAADVLEPILELLVRLHELLVHVPKFLATTSRSFELLTEPTGHLFDVAVEIASVLLEAAVEFVLGHAAEGRCLMSGGHHPTVELRTRAAAPGVRLLRTTVRQRRKRRLALRRGPTETGLEALELPEDLIELLGDVGVRIKGNGSHRRRRKWGWDMRRNRRLELGMGLSFRMLEEVDELGDRVVGGSLKPPRGHGPRFRLR